MKTAVNRVCDCSPPEPTGKPTEIETALDEIDSATQALDGLVTTLLAKLVPVCQNTPTSPLKDRPPRDYLTPLAHTLGEKACAIRNLADQVSGTLERLQI